MSKHDFSRHLDKILIVLAFILACLIAVKLAAVNSTQSTDSFAQSKKDSAATAPLPTISSSSSSTLPTLTPLGGAGDAPEKDETARLVPKEPASIPSSPPVVVSSPPPAPSAITGTTVGSGYPNSFLMDSSGDREAMFQCSWNCYHSIPDAQVRTHSPLAATHWLQYHEDREAERWCPLQSSSSATCQATGDGSPASLFEQPGYAQEDGAWVNQDSPTMSWRSSVANKDERLAQQLDGTHTRDLLRALRASMKQGRSDASTADDRAEDFAAGTLRLLILGDSLVRIYLPVLANQFLQDFPQFFAALTEASRKPYDLETQDIAMRWPYNKEDFEHSPIQIVYYRAFLMEASMPLRGHLTAHFENCQWFSGGVGLGTEAYGAARQGREGVPCPGAPLYEPTHILTNRGHDYGLVKTWHDANVPYFAAIRNLQRLRRMFPQSQILFYGVIKAHKPKKRKSKVQLCERHYHLPAFMSAEWMALRYVNRWIVETNRAEAAAVASASRAGTFSSSSAFSPLEPIFFLSLSNMSSKLVNPQWHSRNGDAWHFLDEVIANMARIVTRHLTHSVRQRTAMTQKATTTAAGPFVTLWPPPLPQLVYQQLSRTSTVAKSAVGNRCFAGRLRQHLSNMITCKPRAVDVEVLQGALAQFTASSKFYPERQYSVVKERIEATGGIVALDKTFVDPKTCGFVFQRIFGIAGELSEWVDMNQMQSALQQAGRTCPTDDAKKLGGYVLSDDIPHTARRIVQSCVEEMAEYSADQFVEDFQLMQHHWISCKSDLAPLARQLPLATQRAVIVKLEALLKQQKQELGGRGEGVESSKTAAGAMCARQKEEHTWVPRPAFFNQSASFVAGMTESDCVWERLVDLMQCNEQRSFDEQFYRPDKYFAMLKRQNERAKRSACREYAAIVGRPGSDFSLLLRLRTLQQCGKVLVNGISAETQRELLGKQLEDVLGKPTKETTRRLVHSLSSADG